ncbi:ribose 5-phosphate isomerase B [Desulfotalea psychrophila]|uniref:Probable ribose 5-phosphate isomerase B n=1 Tax=Desulfotalea psychrophila (strain LSv54 / DSM 12343) TaxID=177439 RepID=Q6AJG4_DESPS|nr:ribose 5-phosphate isomerase B [Desulfotalea psychrophila]CAG37516.1 probable ribose 5-phosphate isomerase B [Desulfotalea psychrophila LSv54]
MNIIIASDHGGYELKELLKKKIVALGHTIEDVGCDSLDSVDYPDYAQRAVDALVEHGDRGVLICGTGIGMSIAANRNRSVRAALCHDEYTAAMSREHNDANILCMGARVLSPERAQQVLHTWLTTEFVGGRHLQRITKFSDI